MTLSQALDAVSKFYVPGVVGYYAKLTPDPWQMAHDQLEDIALLEDEELRDHACQRFVFRCRELVDRFKAEGQGRLRHDFRDSFVIGDPTRDRAWRSRREKACYKCEARSGLTLEQYGADPMEVRIACKDCRMPAAKKAAR